MPAVDYNYDYYSSNARKINKTANRKRATKRVDSSVSASLNRKEAYERRTRQSTKDQVRMATYETPKKPKTTKKKNVDIDIPITTKKKVAAKPVEMKLKKPEASSKQKKQAMEKAMNRVKNVCYLLIGFGIAFLICYRYSFINEFFNENAKIEKEVIALKTVHEQKVAERDAKQDTDYLENRAIYQEAMRKPTESDVIFVTFEKQDKIVQPAAIEEDVNKPWFEQLYNTCLGFFEQIF